MMRHRSREPRTVTALAIAALALVAVVSADATGLVAAEVPGGADVESLDVRLSAAFYADTSCLLTIDQRARTGRTLIDATLGDGGSRTLIHCDTEDGQRLTVLARGIELGRYNRMPLLARASIDDGAKGVIAWLTNAGQTFPDESAPRRYVTDGHVLITDAPQVRAAGTAPNVDHQEFARVDGVLETLLVHPDGGASAER